jgi:hypothetical protein
MLAASKMDALGAMTTARFERLFDAKTRARPAADRGVAANGAPTRRRGPAREVVSSEYMYVGMGLMNVALYSKGVLDSTWLDTPYSLKVAIVVRPHSSSPCPACLYLPS